jgi:hypothetical protein
MAWADGQKYQDDWPPALANGPAIGPAPTGNALNPSRLSQFIFHFYSWI